MFSHWALVGPFFFGNFHSIILMDAGHSVEDLWFKSPLCSAPSHKEAGSRMGGGLCLDPVIGVCKGAFLGKLVALLYTVLLWACV